MCARPIASLQNSRRARSVEIGSDEEKLEWKGNYDTHNCSACRRKDTARREYVWDSVAGVLNLVVDDKDHCVKCRCMKSAAVEEFEKLVRSRSAEELANESLSVYASVFLLAVLSSSSSTLWSAETFPVPRLPLTRHRLRPVMGGGRQRHRKKHSLDVEFDFLRGGSRTVSALIGGSVDFIIGSDLGVTTAILQGLGLPALGVTTNTLGYSMVILSPASKRCVILEEK